MHNRDSIKGKIGIKVALAIVNEAKSSANRFDGERQKKEPALIINGEIIECKFIMCQEECQRMERTKKRCH